MDGYQHGSPDSSPIILKLQYSNIVKIRRDYFTSFFIIAQTLTYRQLGYLLRMIISFLDQPRIAKFIPKLRSIKRHRLGTYRQNTYNQSKRYICSLIVFPTCILSVLKAPKRPIKYHDRNTCNHSNHQDVMKNPCATYGAHIQLSL